MFNLLITDLTVIRPGCGWFILTQLSKINKRKRFNKFGNYFFDKARLVCVISELICIYSGYFCLIFKIALIIWNAYVCLKKQKQKKSARQWILFQIIATRIYMFSSVLYSFIAVKVFFLYFGSFNRLLLFEQTWKVAKGIRKWHASQTQLPRCETETQLPKCFHPSGLNSQPLIILVALQHILMEVCFFLPLSASLSWDYFYSAALQSCVLSLH